MRWWIAYAILSVSSVWAGPTEDLRASLENAHAQKLFESATVFVGKNEEVLFQARFGGATSVDARFDLASLTKPFATALSVHALIDRGLLTLDTKVSTILPGFTGGLRDRVTIADLLAHEAGLPAGISEASMANSPANFEAALSTQRLATTPGTKFVYSDSGYQMLGLVVEKVSGLALSDFAAQAIYSRLGLAQTSYSPADARPVNSCANCPAKPHDPIAKFLYPRSVGHAGLFSTAPELAQIVRMILRHGRDANGNAVLSEASVARLTRAQGLGLRGHGFDLLSEYSTSVRGEIFPPGISFGHTGYTGTSVWIDPTDGKFVILLTNRTAKADTPASRTAMSALRKAVATLAAQL